jgi:hypothetical protein
MARNLEQELNLNIISKLIAQSDPGRWQNPVIGRPDIPPMASAVVSFALAGSSIYLLMYLSPQKPSRLTCCGGTDGIGCDSL